MSRKCEALTLEKQSFPNFRSGKDLLLKCFWLQKSWIFSCIVPRFRSKAAFFFDDFVKISRFVIKRVVYKPRIRKYKISSDFHVLSILLTGNVFRDEIIGEKNEERLFLVVCRRWSQNHLNQAEILHLFLSLKQTQKWSIL